MSHTYRVVVVRSDSPAFHGASGVYASSAQAKGELLDIARSWVGLADSLQLNHDGSFVITYAGVTHTYSILSERKATAFEGTPFGFESDEVQA
jgi:hypothetical protein